MLVDWTISVKGSYKTWEDGFAGGWVVCDVLFIPVVADNCGWGQYVDSGKYE